MMKLMLGAALFFAATLSPASATQSFNRIMGDHFTSALNALEACGALDTLNTGNRVFISDIRQDGDKVYVLLWENEPAVIVYDIEMREILTENVCEP